MAHNYTYPAIITPDEGGAFLVEFPDLPEAITFGHSLAKAIEMAEDCLDEAIAGRIADKEAIPSPSPLGRGQYLIPVPTRMALKAALYQALAESGLTGTDAARKAGLRDTQIRRLLDPRHNSDVSALQDVLSTLGKSVQVRVVNSRAA